jgi:tetratricopeptide (TPR) repeat protein
MMPIIRNSCQTRPFARLVHSVVSALVVISVPPLSADSRPWTADGFLIQPGAAPQNIQLHSATKTSVRYQTPTEPGGPQEFVLGGANSVYVCEPTAYAEAIDLYEGRKYLEAMAKFQAVKDQYQPLNSLDDNPSTLAAFYEMECLRKLGDLEGLALALQKFSKTPLTRESQQLQLELYVLWDAVRSASWQRLETLAKERATSRLPSDARAQVAYCHGLALEGQQRASEALIHYNTALTAGAGASEDVVKRAALRILAIYAADPTVQAALDHPANAPATALSRLSQARAIARWFETSLGAGSPLPAQYQRFIK